MSADPQARPLYIFDLDGTLRSCEHRLHLLQNDSDPDKWVKFYMACENDPPLMDTVNLLNRLLSTGVEVWFFSGSGDMARQITIDWLLKYTNVKAEELTPLTLRMRPMDNIHTPDYVVKRQWYYEMSPLDRTRLAGVFEDRASVVNMWRQLGVTCYQVDVGDF